MIFLLLISQPVKDENIYKAVFARVLSSLIWELKKTTTATTTGTSANKRLMSRTMAVHVHFNIWYFSNSLPSSVKQQVPCWQGSLTTRQNETRGERPLPASDEFPITHALAFP